MKEITVEEIENTLQERPDIDNLFNILMTFPEEKRGAAAATATAFLNSRKADK